MTQLRLILVFFFLLILSFNLSGRQSAYAARQVKHNTVISFAELPEFNIPPGKITYDRYCSFCHGNDGKGDGLNAFSLQKRPADLQVILQDRSDKEVADVIGLGGLAVKLSDQMPSFARTLSSGKLRKLIKYLRETIQNKQ